PEKQIVLSNVLIVADTIDVGLTNPSLPTETFTLKYGEIAETVDPSAYSRDPVTSVDWNLQTGSVSGGTSAGTQTVSGEVLTLSLAGTQIALDSYTVGFGTPAGDGSAALHELKVTAPWGWEAPYLLRRIADGNTLSQPVTLTVWRGSTLLTERFTFSDVKITSEAFTFDYTQGIPEQTFTLAYAQVKEETFGVSNTGQQIGPMTTTATQTTNSSVSLSPLPVADYGGPDAPNFKYFMYVNGLQGNTTDTKHSGAFDVTAFTYGVRAGQYLPVFDDFRVSLSINQLSGNFLAKLASAANISQVKVIAANTAGTEYDFATWTLNNVQFTSDRSASPDDKQPTETFTLHFTKVTESITPTNQDGTPGTPITAAYDFGTASATGATTFGGASVPDAPFVLDFGSGQAAVQSFSIGFASHVTISGGEGVTPRSNAPLTMDFLPVALAPGPFSPAVLSNLAQGTVFFRTPITLTLQDAGGDRVNERLTLYDVQLVSDAIVFGDDIETLH